MSGCARMMGHTHALSGAVAWFAAVPLIGMTDMTALRLPDIAAGALVCAGSALLPDIDHPSATIAQTYGPITELLSRGVNAISGGHRHATHSLFFVVLAAGLTEGMAMLSHIAVQVFAGLLIGFALRGLAIGVPGRRIGSAVVNAMVNAGLLGGFALLDVRYMWIGIAVGLGCLVHLIGDCITTEGCPLLWPSMLNFTVPIVPRTGGRVERFLITPLLVVVGAVLAYWAMFPHAAEHTFTRLMS